MSLRDQVAAVVQQVMRGVERRVGVMIARGILDASKDGEGIQKLTIERFADEVVPDVDHLLPSGFTCRVLKGAEGVVLCIGGHSDNAVGVGFQKRGLRPALAVDGECALYLATGNPAVDGLKVRLLADGDVEITPTAKLIVSGDIEASGEVTANAGGASVTLSGHQHGTGVGPTTPPTPGT